VSPEPVFDGGCSLKVVGRVAPGAGFVLPLFRARADVGGAGSLSVAYTAVVGERCELALLLTFEQGEGEGKCGPTLGCRVVLGRDAMAVEGLPLGAFEDEWLGPEQARCSSLCAQESLPRAPC